MTARDRFLKLTGFGLGVVNAARHRSRGYRTPRTEPLGGTAQELAYARAVVATWEAAGADFAGRAVLELGPGRLLGTGLLAFAGGATSYLAVDGFDVLAPDAQAHHRRLAAELFGAGAEAEAAAGRLRRAMATFGALEDHVDGFDLCVSNAVLEHVEDPGAAFVALRALARPGALMVHHVDARTHMRPLRTRDPLNIHRFRASTYARLLDFPGAPNRWVRADYASAASDAGWTEVRVLPVTVAGEAYLTRTAAVLDAPPERLRDLTFTLVARV